jgi:adhesin transport system membrane fusion protein
MADKGQGKGPNYTDFLPEAQAISEQRHSPLASVMIMLIAGFFLIIILWAALAEVDQSVVAPGEVRPGGKVKVVNHPEGGAVAEVLVRDGDLVDSGQALLILDDQLIKAEEVRLRGDLLALEAQLARLEAEGAGAVSIQFPASVIAERPDLVANHSSLFRARRAALSAQRESADREIEQGQSEINSLQVRIRTLQSSAGVLQEQVSSLQTLTDKGHFPFLRFQSVQRQLNETEGELQQTRESLDSAISSLSAAKSRRREIDDTARSGVLTELSEVRSARDRTAAALDQADTRLERTVIRSPVAGYVQNLVVNNSGQAVRPNEPLMSIVPESDELIVEVRVANKDISAIEIGQEAIVKVRAYDFIKFGSLEGRVERIAKDANRDQQTGQVFFNVDIRTDTTFVGEERGVNEVRPGMEVDAELKSGSRSVLSFLTDRVIGTTDEAFRQR